MKCLTQWAEFLLVAVFTARSGRVHLTADAGLRLSVPGHVSLPPVLAGSGAAAGPEQPSPGLSNQDLTQPAFNLMTDEPVDYYYNI